MKFKNILFLILAIFLIIGVVTADTTQIFANNSLKFIRGSVNEDMSIVLNPGTDIDVTDNLTVGLTTSTIINNFSQNRKFGMNFHNTSLNSSMIIDSGQVCIYGGQAGGSTIGSNFGWAIYKFSPTNKESFVISDYSKSNYQLFSDYITYSNWKIENYNCFNLSSTGISNINLTGSTPLILGSTWEATSTFNGTWVISSTSFNRLLGTATVKKPYMNLTWHLASSPTSPPDSIINLSSGYSCNSILWTWTNPIVNFTGTMIYKNGVFFHNVSTPYDTWTGLNNNSVYTISTKTYNSAGIANTGWVNGSVTIPTCAGFPGPMGALAHNSTNLSISTYDGTGQEVHPSVLFTNTLWNGFRYLMAFTPYAGANPALENPSMRYSNDKTTWLQIVGQPDPIISAPASGYNSDPNIALVGNLLYLFYRITGPSNSFDFYNFTTSTDGVTFSTPTKTNLVYNISASFLWNGTEWQAWGRNASGTMQWARYDSTDGITYINQKLTSGLVDETGTPIAHLEIKNYDGQIEALGMNYSFNKLYYFNSSDGGITFIPSESNPVMQGFAGHWDENLYKASFIEKNNAFAVWYSGYTPSAVYHVGYSSSGSFSENETTPIPTTPPPTPSTGLLNVTVLDKGIDYIKWGWDSGYILNYASIDGTLNNNLDPYTNTYVLSNLQGNTVHTIRLYNSTGQAGYNETRTLTSPETQQEKFFSTVNLYIIFILGLLCVFAGIVIPLFGFGAVLFAILGFIGSLNNSFTMGMLFMILFCAGVLEAFTGFNR